MSTDLRILKAAVPLRDLVSETHEINRNGKVLCPAHDDHTPSCHIYGSRYHCFSCKACGDAVDWLKLTQGFSTAEAIRELERRAGGYIPPVAAEPIKGARALPSLKPISNHLLKQHTRAAERLRYMPQAMRGRGFTLADLRSLGFATYADDAVFPVTGPDGAVLALKRRCARPGSGPRYLYTTPGHGTPAWCSPAFQEAAEVLVIEGELNGMTCWLARPELGVMGVAGTGGTLYTEALRGHTVYVYADGDRPGQEARDKWAAQALEAGAAKVLVLEYWVADACEAAGKQGRQKLQMQLQNAIRSARPLQTLTTHASPIARFFADGNGNKPNLCKRATDIWSRPQRKLL